MSRRARGVVLMSAEVAVSAGMNVTVMVWRSISVLL